MSHPVRYIAILISTLLLLASCSPAIDVQPVPLVIDGKLDLRHWDGQALVPVAGSVKYQKLTPANANLAQTWQGEFDSTWQTLELPGDWQNLFKGDKGCYLIGLQIQVNPAQRDLAVYVKSSAEAYQLYTNRAMLLSSGQPALSREATRTYRTAQFETLQPAEDGHLNIAWQLATFHQNSLPPATAIPLLGKYTEIRNLYFREMIYSIIGQSIVLIFALYFLFLWLMLKQEKKILFLAAIFFMALLRLISTSNYWSLLLNFRVEYEWMAKTEYIVSLFAWIFYLFYLKALFPQRFRTKVRYLYYLAVLPYILVVLFTQHHIYSEMATVINVFLILGNILIVYWALTILQADKTLTYKLEVGSILFLCCGIIAGTSISMINTHTDYSIPHGELFFIFPIVTFCLAQLLLLSYNVKSTFQLNEQLKQNLEIKVADRTRKLESAMRRLEEAVRVTDFRA